MGQSAGGGRDFLSFKSCNFQPLRSSKNEFYYDRKPLSSNFNSDTLNSETSIIVKKNPYQRNGKNSNFSSNKSSQFMKEKSLKNLFP